MVLFRGERWMQDSSIQNARIHAKTTAADAGLISYRIGSRSMLSRGVLDARFKLGVTRLLTTTTKPPVEQRRNMSTRSAVRADERNTFGSAIRHAFIISRLRFGLTLRCRRRRWLLVLSMTNCNSIKHQNVRIHAKTMVADAGHIQCREGSRFLDFESLQLAS